MNNDWYTTLRGHLHGMRQRLASQRPQGPLAMLASIRPAHMHAPARYLIQPSHSAQRLLGPSIRAQLNRVSLQEWSDISFA